MEKERKYLDNIKKVSFLSRISLWWNHDGRYILKNIKYGINNIIKWLPVIWKDRDYDNIYIYEILKHKLKKQSVYIRKFDRLECSKYNSDRINICVNLIQKIQDDFYGMEYYDYHKEKIYFENCDDRPGFSTLESELIWEKLDEYIAKYPLIHKRVLNGEGPFKLKGTEYEIKKSTAMNIAHINSIRAKNLLFRIIKDNIDNWWD